ncbi:SDR family oxidoreductase [Streptomyces sp. NPDC000609]|uniref:SDR family oxidoreductase n=1 Tax=Streptomyces sp. NPDC000609 TaxID=3160957 RepID=UPI0033965EA6
MGLAGAGIAAVAPCATRAATNGSSLEAPGPGEQIAAVTALDQPGGPDDIANVVAFLASHTAHRITGQVTDASGGLLLGPRT